MADITATCAFPKNNIACQGAKVLTGRGGAPGAEGG